MLRLLKMDTVCDKMETQTIEEVVIIGNNKTIMEEYDDVIEQAKEKAMAAKPLEITPMETRKSFVQVLPKPTVEEEKPKQENRKTYHKETRRNQRELRKLVAQLEERNRVLEESQEQLKKEKMQVSSWWRELYDERLQILAKNEILEKICKIQNIYGNRDALLGNGKAQIPMEAGSNPADQLKEASQTSDKQLSKKIRLEQTPPIDIPLEPLEEKNADPRVVQSKIGSETNPNIKQNESKNQVKSSDKTVALPGDGVQAKALINPTATLHYIPQFRMIRLTPLSIATSSARAVSQEQHHPVFQTLTPLVDTAMTPEEYGSCKKLMGKLRSQTFAAPFLQMEGFIDISTIEQQLHNRIYISISASLEDLGKVFQNRRQYSFLDSNTLINLEHLYQYCWRTITLKYPKLLAEFMKLKDMPQIFAQKS